MTEIEESLTKSYFDILNAIDVTGKTEHKTRKNKKTGAEVKISYLSWAWAWGELKKIHPEAIYTIYENKDGWIYHTDGKTAWVKVGVSIKPKPDEEYFEHIEILPVMDFAFNSIPVSSITSFEVNSATQRALTKAIARHGLGLYIYAGEDIPETLDEKETPTWNANSESEQARAIYEQNKRLAEKRAAAEAKSKEVK